MMKLAEYEALAAACGTASEHEQLMGPTAIALLDKLLVIYTAAELEEIVCISVLAEKYADTFNTSPDRVRKHALAALLEKNQ